jgi:hypothetical protein
VRRRSVFIQMVFLQAVLINSVNNRL